MKLLLFAVSLMIAPVQAEEALGFQLVDHIGLGKLEVIPSNEMRTGLLMFNGTKVCHGGFNDNAAEAICKEMGYPGAFNWTTEMYYDAHDYVFGINAINCTTTVWDECTYEYVPQVGLRDHCYLPDQIHLTCRLEEYQQVFKLVDSDNGVVEPPTSVLGLLLYNNKTVCGRYIDNQSTRDMFCKQLGYLGAVKWRITAAGMPSRYNYDVGIDKIYCRGDTWDTCTYVTDGDCNHSDDILVQCSVPAEQEEEEEETAICAWEKENKEMEYCCDKFEHLSDDRCDATGAGSSQFSSLITIAATAAITCVWF